MSREIKFRAWDKITKMMFTNVLDARAVGSLSINEYACWENVMKDENFEIMQFTGLHDKNGKEIYEGDILRHPDFKSSILSKSVGVIEFTRGCYKLSGWDCVRTDFEVGEIIGNIYENKELLA